MAVNFVKFQRGSEAAYNKLLAANRVDNDTLYFIYDEDSAAIGKLYLGKRLIDGGESALVSDIKLEDLENVVITEVKQNSLLVHDGINWTAKQFDEVADLNNWISKNRNSVDGLFSTEDENNLSTALKSLENLTTTTESIKSSVNSLSKQVNDITTGLNNYVSYVEYTNRMNAIDQEVDDLKNAVTWSSIET